MKRARYHHGDLRNALLDAAARLAEKGPESVTIRSAAKLVGVTPTAAYRHFAGHDELMEAVKERAIATLSRAMGAQLDKLPAVEEPALAALNRLAALGRGYVGFAVAEPGLFRTAFFRGGTGPLISEPPVPGAEEEPEGPFNMLAVALDELVAIGYLAPESRPMAEVAAWASVHGLATMMIEGPMAELPDEQRALAIDRTIAAIGLGLADGPNAEPLRMADEVRHGMLGR